MECVRSNSIVGPTQAILSSVMSIFFYVIVIAAVWKLFQIGTVLGEIKTILADLRRNAASPIAKPVPFAPPALPGPISLESAEALLREVAAESQVLAASEPRKA
jgi:hypothetical protein